MDSEMLQLYDKNVFDKSDYTYLMEHNYNIVNTMWVLQIKRDKVTGDIEKYKARLVASEIFLIHRH